RRPKAAPTKQRKMPMYISVAPVIPPKPANFTASSGGMMISASLAEAPNASPIAINNNVQYRIDFIAIRIRRETMQNGLALANHYLSKTAPYPFVCWSLVLCLDFTEASTGVGFSSLPCWRAEPQLLHGQGCSDAS